MGRVLILLVVFGAFALSSWALPGMATAADDQEAAFLGLINGYRADYGLAPLAPEASLTAAAEYHSLDMGTSGYFSHTLSDGTTAGENLVNHGYLGGTWGENIVAGMESAYDAFVAWQNSPGHNANMLREDFGTIGIGRAYVEGSPASWYWTTTFGGAADGASVPSAIDVVWGN